MGFCTADTADVAVGVVGVVEGSFGVDFLGQLVLGIVGVAGTLIRPGCTGDLCNVARRVIRIAQLELREPGAAIPLGVVNGRNLSGLVAAVGAVGVVLPVNPVVPRGQPFQRVVGKGVGGKAGAFHLRKAAVSGAVGERLFVKGVPQLPGLAHQAVLAVVQMLRALLDGGIVGLVAVNQSAKTIVFIVYRLSSGHVKLFRQIALRIVEIPVFQLIAPFFLSNSVKNVIGIADRCPVPIGHRAEIAVLGAIVVTGKGSAAHGNAGHVSKTVIFHSIGLVLFGAGAWNVAAAHQRHQIAAGVAIVGGNHVLYISSFWPIRVGDIGMAADRSVGLRLIGYISLGVVSIARCASVGIGLAGQLGSIGGVFCGSDNFSGRRIAVGGQGGCSAVSVLIVGDVHGNIVVGNLCNQVVIVAVLVLVCVSAARFALRFGQLIPGSISKAAVRTCCIDGGNISVGVIGIGIARLFPKGNVVKGSPHIELLVVHIAVKR